MKSEPSVSVIIPVYNTADYLSDCLDSIVNQTQSNIEIIIVDDGSTDNSVKIVENYQEYTDAIILLSQVNKGLASARNYGLSQATGKYIYFMDSDDYLELNALEILYNRCLKDNLDAIFFDAKVFLDPSEYNKEQVSNFWPSYTRDKEYGYYKIGEELFTDFVKTNNYSPSACLFMVKKSIYTKKLLKFKSGLHYEDELFTPKLMCSLGSCFHLKKNLYNRRIRRGSLMTDSNDSDKLNHLTVVLKELYQFYDDHMFRNSSAKRAYAQNMNNILTTCLNMLQNMQGTKNIELTEDLHDLINNSNFLSLKNQLFIKNYSIYTSLARLKHFIKGDKK